MSWGYYVTAAVVDPPENVRQAILDLGYGVRDVGAAPPSEFVIERTVVFDIWSPGQRIAEQAEEIIKVHGLCGFVCCVHKNRFDSHSTTILDGDVVGRSWEGGDEQHPLSNVAKRAANYYRPAEVVTA